MEGAPIGLGLEYIALKMQSVGEIMVTLPFSLQAVTGPCIHHLVPELLQMPSNWHPCLGLASPSFIIILMYLSFWNAKKKPPKTIKKKSKLDHSMDSY